MKLILAACTATLLATAAFAAEPMAPPAPAGTGTMATPAMATAPEACSDMITRARAMPVPSDPDKAKMAKDELAAADDAGDDATCKTHATNALGAMGGM